MNKDKTRKTKLSQGWPPEGSLTSEGIWKDTQDSTSNMEARATNTISISWRTSRYPGTKRSQNRAAIIHNIQKVEEMDLTYGHRKYVVKDSKYTNLTQVMFPTTQKWETTCTDTELQQRILQQQHTHFSQANNTLKEQHYIAHREDTMHQSLYQAFRNNNIQDTPEGLKRFFSIITNKEMSTRITLDKFTKGIKQWKEKPSTSPSGRHLSHYHVQILPPMTQEKINSTDIFVRTYTAILNLSVKNR